MKKTLSFLLLFICLNMGYSAHIQFFKGTYQQLLAEAEKQNKLVFMDFSAIWCRYCMIMNTTTFEDEKLCAFMDEYFISYQVDADEDTILAKNLGASPLPYTLFMKPSGKVMWSFHGYIDADLLLAMAKTYTGYNEQRANYLKNQKSANALFEYMKILAPNYPDSAYQFCSAFLDKMPRSQWVKPENWKIIRNFINKTECPEFQYVLNNAAYFYQNATEVDAYFLEIFDKMKNNAIYKRDNSLWEKYRKYYPVAMQGAEKMPLEYYQFEADAEYFAVQKNENQYLTTLSNWFTKYGDKIPANLYAEKALQTVKFFKTIPALESGEKWAKKAIEISNNVDTEYALSFVYFRKASYTLSLNTLVKAEGLGANAEQKKKIESLRVQIDAKKNGVNRIGD